MMKLPQGNRRLGLALPINCTATWEIIEINPTRHIYKKLVENIQCFVTRR